ncbi:hypothetical protein GLP25_20075 [Photobacterium phosphoreum]|uniref:hypothetical protein n=1 Tax=Photobacterium phosphoreum TaxID=659 RepID=UPI001E2D535D|nr:hypothetical protein [Photobacterium phosphoreum]MCD9485461.1 hypothetical protein [Photobacterium phosphoreum]
MKYELQTRKIINSDIGINCPYMPKDGEYELCLIALLDDIKNLNVVLNATNIGSSVFIEIKEDADFQELHTNVKSIMGGDMFSKLRGQLKAIK